MLTYNLEPIYGIGLALLLFPETEIMSTQFYYGAILILLTVLMDALFKKYNRKNKATSVLDKTT